MTFGISTLRQQRETHTQTNPIPRSIVFLWLCAMALAGCDALESPEDSKAKSDLVGSWYLEYKDLSERPVKSVVTLTEDGQFTSRERIGDETTESRSSGGAV